MEIPFSGFELVFIILAFTVFCVFGLAAIYTHNRHADNQGETILMEHHKRRLKKENRNSNLQENKHGTSKDKRKDKMFYP